MFLHLLLKLNKRRTWTSTESWCSQVCGGCLEQFSSLWTAQQWIPDTSPSSINWIFHGRGGYREIKQAKNHSWELPAAFQTGPKIAWWIGTLGTQMCSLCEKEAVLAGQSWGAWEGCRKSTENNLCLFLQMQSSGSGWSWTQWQKCKHINASKAIWLCSKCEVLKLQSQWRFELPKKSWAAEECWINPIHHMFSEGQVEGSFSLGTPGRKEEGCFMFCSEKWVWLAVSFCTRASRELHNPLFPSASCEEYP